MLLTTAWTQITTIAGLGASVQKGSIDKVLVKYGSVQPTNDDDAAAGSGGLVAGDIYATTAGDLKIKL